MTTEGINFMIVRMVAVQKIKNIFSWLNKYGWIITIVIAIFLYLKIVKINKEIENLNNDINGSGRMLYNSRSSIKEDISDLEDKIDDLSEKIDEISEKIEDQDKYYIYPQSFQPTKKENNRKQIILALRKEAEKY